MALNEKYSRKDFTGKKLIDTDPQEWNGTEVYGSCFAQEQPDTEVFPNEIKDVTFINCNLDNCVVPETCRIIGGTHKRIKAQNDLEDWIVDENDMPIEPVNKKMRLKMGISIDPKDIPAEKLAEPVTFIREREAIEQVRQIKQAVLSQGKDIADPYVAELIESELKGL